MANRFPLIIDENDNKIKEIPENDNLSLQNNNIIGVVNITSEGTITAESLYINSETVNINGKNFSNVAFTGKYIDLVERPLLFTGSYNDLTDKPTLFTGSYNDLTDKPANLSQFNNDVGFLTLSESPTLSLIGTTLRISNGNSVDLSGLGSSGDGSGIALTNLSVTNLAAAGSGTLTYDNTTGVFNYTPPDLSSYLTSYTETDPVVGAVNGIVKADGAGNISAAVAGTDYSTFDGDYNSLTNKPTIPNALTDLGIIDGTNGQVLTTDGAGNFSFTTVTSGTSYTDSDVDTHLNTSTAGVNEVLSWTGTDYDWIAQTGSSGVSTFGIAGNTGTHTFDTSTETLTFLGTTGQINASIAANNVTLELDPNINSITSIAFEGTTDDNFETTISAIDPTADRTIQFPDASGTVALTSDLGSSTDTLSDVTARGAVTSDAVTINNTLTVTSLDSTGLGFATLQSASDISLNAVGDINANSSKITNVVDPIDLQDAATKNYVDTAISNNLLSFNITAPDSSRYSYTGSGFIAATDNPVLYLYRGFTYLFIINSPGHPFYFTTDSGDNFASGTYFGEYTDGVTGSRTDNGTITFMVPMNAPADLYYYCGNHSAMNGSIRCR